MKSEEWIVNLLGHVKQEYSIRTSNGSVLDLGCKTAKTLYQLHHHDKSYERFVGIDNDGDRLSDGRSALDFSFKGRTPFEYYQSLNHPEKIKEKAIFDKTFSLNLNQDVFDYFKESDEQFDLIILSNFLHLFPSRNMITNLFNQCIVRLKKGGLIYVYVANEKHSYQNESDRYAFSNQDLRLLTSDLNILYWAERRFHCEVILQKK